MKKLISVLFTLLLIATVASTSALAQERDPDEWPKCRTNWDKVCASGEAFEWEIAGERWFD